MARVGAPGTSSDVPDAADLLQELQAEQMRGVCGLRHPLPSAGAKAKRTENWQSLATVTAECCTTNNSERSSATADAATFAHLQIHAITMACVIATLRPTDCIFQLATCVAERP